MKSSKGITLTSLAITIVLTLILATIVIKTSIHSLKTMQLENFKSKIEEVQRKVDEISSSYDNYKKVNVDASYKEYFESKFGSSPGFLKDNEGLAKELLETKENLNNNKESELIFYFKENRIKPDKKSYNYKSTIFYILILTSKQINPRINYLFGHRKQI